MPGLVFVLDAEARPLMPMSGAYARTLCHQGKAQVQPHPTFSIIQLTRVVDNPVLRPVLLGVVVHPQTADIIIVVDQTRSPPSHLHVGVDFRVRFRRGRQRHRKWALPWRRRLLSSSRAAVEQQQATMLRGVITALQDVLPISHLALLPSAHRLPLTRAVTRRMQRRLAAETAFPVVQLPGVGPTRLASVGVRPELVPTLRSILARVQRHTPQVVVWPLFGSLPAQAPDTASVPNASAVGRIGRVRLVAGPSTGVIASEHPNGSMLLRVPIGMNRRGIRWRYVRTSTVAVERVWTFRGVAVLPLGDMRG